MNLKDIFSELKLTAPQIYKLSAEAKAKAIGFGKIIRAAELDEGTWDVFEAMSDKVWDSSMSSL